MGEKIKGILQELVGDDTRAIALFGMDGQVVDAVSKGGQELQEVAPDLAALLKVGAYCARKLDAGDIEHVTMTTKGMAMLAVSVGPAHYVAVVLGGRANVAGALMQIRKRRSELIEELP